MSKPYLTSMQITDDHGRPATDYVNTCWKGQPVHHVKLPTRFSSVVLQANILSGYNSSRDKPENFIRCPYAQ